MQIDKYGFYLLSFLPAPLFLKRQCDRTLGGPRDAAAVLRLPRGDGPVRIRLGARPTRARAFSHTNGDASAGPKCK